MSVSIRKPARVYILYIRGKLTGDYVSHVTPVLVHNTSGRFSESRKRQRNRYDLDIGQSVSDVSRGAACVRCLNDRTALYICSPAGNVVRRSPGMSKWRALRVFR